MASMKKCKNCSTRNEKTKLSCSNCGQALYKDVNYNIAIKMTIILDFIMTIVYIVAAILFVDTTNNITMENIYYIEKLPRVGSIFYYAVIAFFIINALVRVLFILNHFALKTKILILVRRIFMFVEAIYMFPIQSILALYFYNPATKNNISK